MKISAIFGLSGIGIFLLFACASPEIPAESVAQVVATPISPIITPIGTIVATSVPPTPESTVTPEPTATPVYLQPPSCQFQPSFEVNQLSLPKLDKFAFSIPEVVVSRETPIEIIEWLPDNQHLLLHVRDQTTQSIELLDSQSKQTQVYARSLQNVQNIHWIPEEQGVGYIDRKTVEFSGFDQYGLWISRGSPDQIELLLADAELLNPNQSIPTLPPAVADKYLPPNYPFDAEEWRYPKYPNRSSFLESWADIPFTSTESPNGQQAVFYGVPWLFLVDLQNNQPCEVEIGQYFWAFQVDWSPNGRWLAMLIANNPRRALMETNQVVILDTISGELYRPDLDLSHVWEMAWFPNSYDLILMGYKNTIENPAKHQQLLLVNTLHKTVTPVLQDFYFGGGSNTGFQLALSQNGESLSVKCPIWADKRIQILMDQICIISIKSNGK